MANYHSKRDKKGRFAQGSGNVAKQPDRKVKLTRQEKLDFRQSVSDTSSVQGLDYGKISQVFHTGLAPAVKTVPPASGPRRSPSQNSGTAPYRRPKDKKLRYGAGETFHAGTKNVLESLKKTLTTPIVEENKKTGAKRNAPFDVRKARNETKATVALVASYEPALHKGTPTVYSPGTKRLAMTLLEKDPKEYFIKNPNTGGSNRLAPETAAFLSAVNHDLTNFSTTVRSKTYTR